MPRLQQLFQKEVISRNSPVMQSINSMSSTAAPPPRSLVLMPWNMTSKFLSFPSRMAAFCQCSAEFCSGSCHTFDSPFSVCSREINTKEETQPIPQNRSICLGKTDYKTNPGTLILSVMSLTSAKPRHVSLLQCFLAAAINLLRVFRDTTIQEQLTQCFPPLLCMTMKSSISHGIRIFYRNPGLQLGMLPQPSIHILSGNSLHKGREEMKWKEEYVGEITIPDGYNKGIVK